MSVAHIGIIESELLVKRRQSRDSIKMYAGALGKARQGSGVADILTAFGTLKLSGSGIYSPFRLCASTEARRYFITSLFKTLKCRRKMKYY